LATYIALPILGLLVVLETSLTSQMKLLYGAVDLVLLAVIAWAVQERVRTAWQWGLFAGLLVSIASALPAVATILGYLLATGAALILRRIFWQRPLLAMVTATFVCSLLLQAVAMVALLLSGSLIPVLESVNLIILPSTLLNLILAIPVYALISDLANWLYPQELEI